MMKQVKFMVATIFFAIVTVMGANAQTSFAKADKFVEGTASYSKTTGADATYGIRPTVGYFLTPKVAVGLFGEVSKNADGQKVGAIGGFGRYYFLTLGKSFHTFAEANLSHNNVKTGEGSANVFAGNVGVGANYFVNNHFALTATVANLVGFAKSGDVSSFTIGFDGVTNPLALSRFGLLYRF